MKRYCRTRLFIVITGILLTIGFPQSYADTIASPSNVTDLTEGAHVWANNCARCHNLRSPTEFSADNDRLIMQHMRIQAGITGKEAREVLAFLEAQSPTTQAPTVNPPVTAQPSEKSAPAAASTTTKTAASKPSRSNTIQQPAEKSSKASSGQAGNVVYQQTCVACHGANGKGTVPGASDFTSKDGPLKKSDAVLLQHIENGYQSPGSPMAMPAKGGNAKLTNDDLKNVLKYIRNTFGK